MFKTILVTLDGSHRAEQAIPIAARLARAGRGSILFLRVVDRLENLQIYAPGSAIFEEILQEELTRATVYLAQIAKSPNLEGIKTRIAVFTGQATPHILEVANKEAIDLIVLCSHGYTGIKRWALGSVAQKVVRQSTTPLLLLRDQDLALAKRAEKGDHPIRAVVALDGSPLAETALLPAAQLVAALSAPQQGELHLIQLVQLLTAEEERIYERLDLHTDFKQLAIIAAERYLKGVRQDLLQEQVDIQISWSVEECQDVADSLIEITASGKGTGMRRPNDLIALATHGRSGFKRWLLGGVTERVLHGTTLPLLIVHEQEKHSVE